MHASVVLRGTKPFSNVLERLLMSDLDWECGLSHFFDAIRFYVNYTLYFKHMGYSEIDYAHMIQRNLLFYS